MPHMEHTEPNLYENSSWDSGFVPRMEATSNSAVPLSDPGLSKDAMMGKVGLYLGLQVFSV